MCSNKIRNYLEPPPAITTYRSRTLIELLKPFLTTRLESTSLLPRATLCKQVRATPHSSQKISTPKKQLNVKLRSIIIVTLERTVNISISSSLRYVSTYVLFHRIVTIIELLSIESPLRAVSVTFDFILL